MGNAILMIVRPLLMSLIFSAVKGILRVALSALDAWLRKKVESTDNKYDDAIYLSFSHKSEDILEMLDKVLELIKGSK